MEKVAVITGGNRLGSTLYLVQCEAAALSSGIGFALAQRLLSEGAEEEEEEEEGRVRVCLACRNMEKAAAAQQLLLAEHPHCKVDTVQVDVSSVASVKAVCAELQRRYVSLTRHLTNT